MVKESVKEGVVVWFNAKKGYGFISVEGEKDIFVHYSDILSEGFKTLFKEQLVTFKIGQNNHGQPKAVDVVVVQTNVR